MKFKYILSPIQAGTKTLKSRLIHTTSYNMSLGMPGFGPQITPEQMFEQATRHFVAIADAGAAILNFSGGSFPDKNGKSSGMMSLSYADPEIAAGFRTMIGVMHDHGSLCVSNLKLEPDEYSICWLDDWDEMEKNVCGDYAPHFVNKPTCPTEVMEELVEEYARQAKGLKDIGFDGMNFHMSYHSSYMCTALSPLLNRRTDKYGGKTLEERARFPLEVLSRVREVCGPDFLIEIQMSAHEEAPGYTVEDWLDFCELAQGLYDIIQIRGFDGSYTHVTSFNSSKEHPHTLQFAEAYKKRGLKGLTAPVGGFNDPVDIERFLSEGRTDLVAMARTWLANQDYAKKIREGRPEDVIPCLGCMGKCDFPCCSVNPDYGWIKNPKLFGAAGSPKKVAVIGGGPAGIRAALAAVQRGHSVTLYEKDQELGGQLKFAKYPWFKWQLNEYLKWMQRQIGKSAVEVRLGVTATPELLKGAGYDALICALGSAPKRPPVPGADAAKVWDIDDVWGREQDLGTRVVVVGGGASARETALYLANAGHKVTMLTRSQEIYTDNSHCIWGQEEQYFKEKNLTVINFATTMEIGDDYVVCEVKNKKPVWMLYRYQLVNRILEGEKKKKTYEIPGFLYPEFPTEEIGGLPPLPEPEQVEEPYTTEIRRIECDSVVVSGGRSPRVKETEAFRGIAPAIYVVGDDVVPGSVQEATLTGYAAAMSL